jgi:hypothetical protein
LTNVSESELDMDRAAASQGRPRIWGLIAAIRWLSPGVYSVHKPRRSVDRENQRFPEPWE